MMFVRNRMTPSPLTVTEDIPILEALELMKVEAQDRPGALAELTGIARDAGVNIASLATFSAGEGYAQIVLRLEMSDPSAIVARFEERGFRVIHVTATRPL